MSELSRQARRAMRAKIHRITKGESGKVDASDYGPEEVLNAGVKTGMRPISRRAFKKGGKVVANEGKEAVKHAGKKPRNGGKKLTIDALVNRNVKDANEDREGIKHIGGMKTGGRAQRAKGGSTWGESTPLRLVKTHKGPNGHVAKVYKDQDWGEYRVKHFSPEGKHLEKADYHTDDRDEANDSAAYAVEKGFNKGGRAKKNNGGGFQFDAPRSGSAKIDTTSQAYKDAAAAAAAARQAAADRAQAKRDANTVARGNRMQGLEASEEAKLMGRKSGGRAKKSFGGDLAAAAMLGLGGLGIKKLIGGSKDKSANAVNEPMKRGGGARKSGGRTHSDEPEDRALIGKMVKKSALTGKKHGGMALDGEYQGTRPKGGRVAKKDGGSLAGLEMNKGGRLKKSGKTNINIVISAGKGQQQDGATPPGMPPRPAGIPVAVPPQGAGAPPAAAPAPMPMPPMGGAPAGGLGGAGPMGSPMPRKAGGRTYRSYKDMDAGAGSGLGRLEKTEIQKHKK